jgi:hypothetical protein
LSAISVEKQTSSRLKFLSCNFVEPGSTESSLSRSHRDVARDVSSRMLWLLVPYQKAMLFGFRNTDPSAQADQSLKPTNQ